MMGHTTYSQPASSSCVVPLAFKPRAAICWSGGTTTLNTSTGFTTGCIGLGALNPISRVYSERSVGHGGSSTFGLEIGGAHHNTGFAAANSWSDADLNATARVTFNCPGTYPRGARITTSYQNPSPQIFGMLAIGGKRTTCKVLVDTLYSRNSTEGAGNRVITGLGFQPKLVIFIWTKGWLNGGNTQFGGSSMGFGAMDASGNQFSWSHINDYLSGTGSIRSYARNDKAASFINYSGGLVATMSFVSMDTDGFTVYFDAADVVNTISGYSTGINGRPVSWLAISDEGSFRVGTATQGQTSISGLGFNPQAFLFTHGNNTAWSTVNGTGISGIGTLADSSSFALSGRGYGGVIKDKALLFSNGGLVAEATGALVAGGCTLNWSSDDGAGRPFGYIAMETIGNDTCFTPSIYRTLEY